MPKRRIVPGEPGVYEHCPCGSGKRSKFCCRTSKGWYCKPHIFDNGAQPTGVSNPGCVAASLADCHGSLTREHVIPLQILDATFPGSEVSILGLPFQSGGAKPIGKGTATSRVTCKRHNNIASPLDDALGRVYKASLASLDPSNASTSQMVLVSGPDVERALLRLVLISVAAKWTSEGGKPVQSDVLPTNLASAIWGDEEFNGGLYAITPRYPHSKKLTAMALAWTAPWRYRGHLVGMGVWIAGIPLAICFRNIPLFGRHGAPYIRAQRRPTRLIIDTGAAQHSITLSWPPEWNTSNAEITPQGGMG